MHVLPPLLQIFAVKLTLCLFIKTVNQRKMQKLEGMEVKLMEGGIVLELGQNACFWLNLGRIGNLPVQAAFCLTFPRVLSLQKARDQMFLRTVLSPYLYFTFYFNYLWSTAG